VKRVKPSKRSANFCSTRTLLFSIVSWICSILVAIAVRRSSLTASVALPCPCPWVDNGSGYWPGGGSSTVFFDQLFLSETRVVLAWPATCPCPEGTSFHASFCFLASRTSYQSHSPGLWRQFGETPHRRLLAGSFLSPRPLKVVNMKTQGGLLNIFMTGVVKSAWAVRGTTCARRACGPREAK
jgi:hypothetical protein